MNKLKVFSIILFVGFIVYFNGLFNDFIGDDKVQILNNSYVHSIKNIPSLFSYGFKSSDSGILNIYYKPLMPISFAIVYSISGQSTFLFHLVQLLLHTTNTFIVFLIFKYFFNRKLSLVLSLFFLVHPLNQEAVQNISSYQDVLFFLFGGFATLVAIYSKLNITRSVLFSFFVFLALLSKESGILFSPIALLFIFLFERTKLKRVFLLETAVSSIYLVIRTRIVNVLPVKIEEAPIMNLDFFERAINIPKIIFYYLRNLIFPTDLSISQQWIVKNINFADFYLPSIIILLTFAALVFYLFRLKSKIFLFFFLWTIIGILPHLHIVPLDMTVAARWFYFPMVGVIGMLGFGIEKILSKKNETLIYSALIVILISLSIRTMVRNANWRDALTLYSHDISYSKGYLIENNLGDELFKVGKKEEAKKYFESSVKDNPEWWIAWNNLGIYYEDKASLQRGRSGIFSSLESENPSEALAKEDKKDYKNAEKYYKKAIVGELSAAYENLARTYLVSGDLDKGREFTKSSLKKFPESPRLWVTLGIVEYKLGSRKNALVALEKSFKLFPAVSTQNLYEAVQSGKVIE